MSNRRKATPAELEFITAAREGERDRLHEPSGRRWQYRYRSEIPFLAPQLPRIRPRRAPLWSLARRARGLFDGATCQKGAPIERCSPLAASPVWLPAKPTGPETNTSHT